MKEAPQIICLTGLRSTGKSQIAHKLAHDFRYKHICANTLIEKQNRGLCRDGVPSDKLVSALLDKIKEGEGSKHLIIEGFPRSREEGLEFEAQFHPIQKIINLVCDDVVLVKRLSKGTNLCYLDGKHTVESASQAVESPKKALEDALHFYESFGVVRNVPSSKDPDEVYEMVKRAMLPQVIFLYGAPTTGKSTVARQLADKIGYELVSLNSFYKRFKITDHLSAVNELIAHLKFSNRSFFIIDDLLPTREEYNIFVGQLGEPFRIFYFDAPKDEVERNIHNYNSEAEAKPALERFLHFVEHRQSLTQQFKDRGYYVRINAVQPLEDITNDIIAQLHPKVLATHYTNQEEEEFVRRLAAEKQWTILDVEHLISGHSRRSTPIGRKISGLQESKKPLAPKHKLDSLKNSLFTSGVQKVLLTGMGEHLDLYESFEHELFPIRMLSIEFEKRKKFLPEDHPLLYFFERGDLLRITNPRVDLVDAKLNRGVNYGVVFGPTSAGKTFLSKAIAKIYGFVLIEWEPTLTAIKEKYPGDEETVPFSKVLRYFKEQFTANSRRTFIFDGFQFEKNFDEFINELGAPSFLINLQVEKPVLVKRTRAKEGADVNAELGEEQSQKIQAAIDKGNTYGKLCEDLTGKHPTSRSFSLDANGTLDATLHAVDAIFSRRVTAVHPTVEEANPVVQKALTTLFKNICFAEDMIYLDVVKLVAKHYHHEKASMHSQLRSQYKMKTSKQEKPESPSHYSPTAVLHILNEHLHHTKQDGQDLLLMGYPSPLEEGQMYPRPSDQLAAVESGLGSVRVVTVIGREEMPVEISDPVMKLEKPAQPIKEKKEEGEPPAEDKPPEQAKKTEYSIFDHIWTQNTGKPKTLGQWYCNLKPNVQRVIFGFMQSTLEMKSYDDHTPFDRSQLFVKRSSADGNAFVQIIRHF